MTFGFCHIFASSAASAPTPPQGALNVSVSPDSPQEEKDSTEEGLARPLDPLQLFCIPGRYLCVTVRHLRTQKSLQVVVVPLSSSANASPGFFSLRLLREAQSLVILSLPAISTTNLCPKLRYSVSFLLTSSDPWLSFGLADRVRAFLPRAYAGSRLDETARCRLFDSERR